MLKSFASEATQGLKFLLTNGVHSAQGDQEIP